MSAGLATVANQPASNVGNVALGAMQLLPHCPDLTPLLLRPGYLPSFVAGLLGELGEPPSPSAASEPAPEGESLPSCFLALPHMCAFSHLSDNGAGLSSRELCLRRQEVKRSREMMPVEVTCVGGWW